MLGAWSIIIMHTFLIIMVLYNFFTYSLGIANVYKHREGLDD